MSIVNIIDTVTEWARVNICDGTRLKMPPDGDGDACPNAEQYDYREITPACFSLYMPTQEKLPPGVLSPIPSVVVRVLSGEDNLTENSGSLKMDMCFSTWNPGTYGKDILIPAKDHPGEMSLLPEEEAAGKFEIYTNGWRDVWNWVDKALRALESTTTLNGVIVDRTVPVTYGPLAEQEGIPDLYPLWFAWVAFSVVFPLNRYDAEVEQFL